MKSNPNSPLNPGAIRVIIVAVFVLIALVVLLNSHLFYFMQRVEQQEVGIRFRGGRIHEVVGPGLYSDVGLYVELKKVPSSAVPLIRKSSLSPPAGGSLIRCLGWSWARTIM
ncbi:MAG: hypothetical protein BWY52_01278 [Chloroflexi bacterium ADurb.Bin325]|nr:MAG: hypothetical protein BWY52_01278 [Chloroflexi bacterium ADurb.Bin325]